MKKNVIIYSLKSLNIVGSKVYNIFLFLLIITINIVSGLTNFVVTETDKQIINTIDNRTIYIYSNDNKDKMNEIQLISHLEKINYNIDPVIIKYGESKIFYLKYFNHIDSVLDGINEPNKNEIIVPESFYYELISQNKNTDSISININNNTVSFIISGKYDDKYAHLQNVYVSSDNEIGKFIDDKYEYIALLDDNRNYEYVKERLEKIGCSIKIYYSNDNELHMYKSINNVLRLFSIVCYALLTLIFILILFNNVVDNIYDIALLKSFGFNYKIICFAIMIKYYRKLIVSFFSSSFLFLIINIILKVFLKKSFLFNIKILIFNYLYISIFFLITIIVIVKKVKKISIVKLLKT